MLMMNSWHFVLSVNTRVPIFLMPVNNKKLNERGGRGVREEEVSGWKKCQASTENLWKYSQIAHFCLFPPFSP